MRGWVKQLGSALRLAGEAAGQVLCWTLWLALVLALAVQIGIAVSHQLKAPGFVLRAFESRLRASHVEARFGQATFDPAGGILLEDLSLSLPEFKEPIIHAGAAYIQLDPWALIAGRFEPRRIHVTGLTLYVPAMLAPSGRSEAIVEDLEFTVAPRDREIVVEHLTGKFGGVALTLRGAYHPPKRVPDGPIAPLPLLENIRAAYGPFTRQLVRLAAELKVAEQPQLDVLLVPAAAVGATAEIRLTARGIHLPKFRELVVSDLLATTRIALHGGGPSHSVLSIRLKEVRSGSVFTARQFQAQLRGTLNTTEFQFQPDDIDFTLQEITAMGFAAQNVSGHVVPETWTKLRAELAAECLGAGAAIDVRTDLTTGAANVRFSGAVSPQLLTPIGALLKKDLYQFIGFGEPLLLDAAADFGPGWKFNRLSGHLDVRKVDAYHVPIDTAHGQIEFDGRHFLAHHARATLGENAATGSFYQDLATREFRFLLEGHLRPLEISGWFREWWPNIFDLFAFPVVPPNASVDVAGRWFAGEETTVFVFADSVSPVVRGVQFDHGRTLLFIRPHFLDGLEAFGTRGTGEARGTFVRRANPTTGEWSLFSLALTSTLDLAAGEKLLGPTLGAELQPYSFERPPSLIVRGSFDGPAVQTPHQFLEIFAQSQGPSTAFQFPATNLSFHATLKDEELVLENVKADVARGELAARAVLSGPKAERRLSFQGELRKANLGEAVTAVVNLAAARRGEQQTTVDKILPGKPDVNIDLALAAEGLFDNPYSFEGTGTAALAGASLGEIRLLGLLSDLLNFTALRFTAARADFKVMGPKVTFPAVSITGSNSAIVGHGDYFLDRRELNFNARVYPFQESKSLLRNMVGIVLTPLSAVLEVKLTGPLEQPNWAFVIGPTNFFRTLSSPSEVPVAGEKSLSPAIAPGAIPPETR